MRLLQMGKISKFMVLVIFSCLGISFGAEYEIKTITKTMDAYEQQIDSIKLTYSCESCKYKNGERDFVKGSFAQKKSEGYILLDEISQKGKAWDNDKEFEGIVRSYNGEVTRYLEHEKNKNGHHMAALYKDHNLKLYKTRENPYYRVWYLNYKNKFTDLLNDPNGMAKIQGEELVDGLKTIKINFKSAEGILDHYLWLLPEKNYLPKKCIIYHKNYKEGKESLMEMYWSDYKKFTGNIWYPMEIKQFVKNDKNDDNPTVIKVEEVDFTPLTKEDFEFKFPALTHVTDHIAGTSYLTTATLEQSSIDQSSELLEINDSNIRNIATDNEMENTITEEQMQKIILDTEPGSHHKGKIVLLAFSLLIVLVLPILLYIRRARKNIKNT